MIGTAAMAARQLSRRDLFVRRTPPTPAREPEPAEFLVRAHRRIMACRVEVVLPGEVASELPRASAALDEGDRLEQVMTIFRQDSELSGVNRTAHSTAVSVSEDLFAVLSLAASITAATAGAFDMTSTPLSRCWGFIRREGRLPQDEEIQQARALVGMPLVDLDDVARTVRFRRPGVELNLGSIGKGFALDRMAAFLSRAGTSAALLSAGFSSIVAIGGEAAPWEVDLRTATTGERLARLRMVDAAVGTSGPGEQFFTVDGRRFGHVIDPRTGWPAAGVLSASVVASSGAVADALSTAFLIGGPELARQYCAEHPEVLAIITPDDEARVPMTFGAHPRVLVEAA